MKPLSVKVLFAVLILTATMSGVSLAGTRQKPASGAEVTIISPKDGETVSSPVTVLFGLKGMGVAPAGTVKENTGHHHLFVDVDKLPPMDQAIPSDTNHIHFGGGQTQTTLTLTPGKHSLQLLLGDATHMPFDPPVISKKIIINVK